MVPVRTTQDAIEKYRVIAEGDSRLRLQTIVRLRWLAVLGQLAAVGFVALGLGFPMPVGPCLFIIALSAWLNVYLSIRYPARHRLSVGFATAMLAYDILQLVALLYLTGGIANPFTMLIVAPVTVSAASLPLGNTIALGALAMISAVFITLRALPLPWYEGSQFQQPFLYAAGMMAAVLASVTFLALYAWRLTKEGRQMSAALAATEHVLAREQKLHALDGLAAAAAHELGTPLSTIALVTKELERQFDDLNPLKDDITLLRTQALRCRDILQKLTREPAEHDPLYESLSAEELVIEAAAAHRNGPVEIIISAFPTAGAEGAGLRSPVGVRRPGIIYGLGNIIENAVDFARSRVDATVTWDNNTVVITIADDGPGFDPELIDSLGEPYVTTRPAGSKKKSGEASGLGLGFFIAKTLLDRSGAILTLQNRPSPSRGAIVRIDWPRSAFQQPQSGANR